MVNPFCQKCLLRGRYDKNPRSWLGRWWRWHAGWCPGWKSYLNSLPEQERRELAARYGLGQFS